MKDGVKFGEFFGPASLLGVVLGTVYLMLIVLRVIEFGVSFGALVIVGFPLMLTSGAVKRFGTGLVVSLAVIPLTLVTFLLGAGIGSNVAGISSVGEVRAVEIGDMSSSQPLVSWLSDVAVSR